MRKERNTGEEALQRRIREFLRHGIAAEAGVEEWGRVCGPSASCVRSCRWRSAKRCSSGWDRMLSRALPDLQLAAAHRESVLLALEAAAAEGVASVTPKIAATRPERRSRAGAAALCLDARPGGAGRRDEDEDEDDCDHEDEMLVLKAADGTEVRFMLADRLVLAHLAADGRGSTGRGAEPATHPGRRAAD